jgi:hypothetical protein
MRGCDMNTPDADNGEHQKSQTDLEIEAGRRAAARYHSLPLVVPPKNANGVALCSPSSFDPNMRVETGIVPPVTATQPEAEGFKGEVPPGAKGAAGTVSGPTESTVGQGSGGVGADGRGGTIDAPGPTGNTGPTRNTGPTGTQPRRSASLDFLDDLFGADKRHLVAIKRNKDEKPDIKAHHFDADDRVGQQQFITDYSAAGFDLYFSPNPIKGTVHKKATKNDVAKARHLWIDLDPRLGESLEAERAAMLAILTTNLPRGMPRPNRVIDSGRGYWGYWKLASPQPVDGSTNNVNGPLTNSVERYGRGIEQAFGDRFADGCRNIDRIARLPGTINTKTGRLANVLSEYSHDTPHAIESFPRSVEKRDQKEG